MVYCFCQFASRDGVTTGRRARRRGTTAVQQRRKKLRPLHDADTGAAKERQRVLRLSVAENCAAEAKAATTAVKTYPTFLCGAASPARGFWWPRSGSGGSSTAASAPGAASPARTNLLCVL